MPLTILTQASSLNSGADLWAIPALSVSKSAQKIDWYLNFQLSKASLHQTPTVNKELKNILSTCDLPEMNFKSGQQQLLINTSMLIPNRWVLQLPETPDLAQWCKAIADVWGGLRKPTLRVFLPTGLSASSFQRSWKEQYSFDDFSIVVD